jgi:Predicted phosphoesterase (MutT family)
MDLQQQPSEELAQDQALPVGEAVAELGNVHPSEAGLAAPTVQPGDEAVDSKDRLVIGYWRDAIDAEFTVQGLEYTADPLKDVMSERFDRIKLDMVMTRRRRLEESPLFRHPIPYVMIHRHNEAKNQIEFFIFQRSKKVGEEKLAGNHSIGAAGHPEAQSMRFYPNWTLNARDAMVASLIEEMDEELDFSGMTFQELIQNCPTTFSHEGFIRDDANDVGKQHLGLVYSVGIPPHIEVTCKEEELITCGFYTLDEITDPASGFNLERWSYILADAYKRLIADDKAKAEEQAQFDEAEAQRASDARAEAERIAQLPAEVLSLEVANAYLESSDFDLLSWKLQEGEAVVERAGQAFFDGFIDHPMEGKKALVIAIDPHDPAPDQTIAAIKASVLEGWDALKGDPVPEEPLDDGNGLELEQEEDGDLPDDLDDEEEAGRMGDEVAEEIRTGQPFGEEVRLPESVERRADGGLNVNYGDNPEIGRGLSRPIELNPELQARAEAAHERNIQQSHSGSGDNVAGDKVYARGQRPEFAHVDEAPFRYDPAPHRDARDDSGYGGGNDSGGSSDGGSSSSD